MAVNNITQTISTIPEAGRRGVDVQTIFVNKQEAFQDALTEVFVGQINTLRSQLNTFVSETNTVITQINTDATTATTQAGIATTKANEASTSASQALTSRNQAETFAQQAQASASSIDVNNIVYRTGDESIAGTKTFSSSPIVPTPTTGTQAVNKNYVDSNASSLPIGAILNGYTIFDNCIVAFGGEFNRADYPKLWAYLQANPTLVKTEAQWITEITANGGICGFFSDGNGTTTFRVPNLNKAFLRPDNRGVGSYQADMFKSHNHGQGYVRTIAGQGTLAINAGLQIVISDSLLTGGTETIPKNIAVLPLIVAKYGVKYD